MSRRLKESLKNILSFSTVLFCAIPQYGLHLTPDAFCDPTTSLDLSTSCRFITLEHINDQIEEPLSRLLATSFFRYYKVDLRKECPFWKDDLVCATSDCGVTVLDKDPISRSLETSSLDEVNFPQFQPAFDMFSLWESSRQEFCVLDQESSRGVYVDLITNPERFTGYSGPAAHKIWNSIYEENCFMSKADSTKPGTLLWSQCEERQVFYRLISGMHASVSIHLASRYYDQDHDTWEPRLNEFITRVGAYPDRLRNLYFTYWTVYRAVIRAMPLLKSYNYGLGDVTEMAKIQQCFEQIEKAKDGCPGVLDDSLFANTPPLVIDEFRAHFRNVTRIMDCVGCESCRLWGKVQTTGLGTALKILFKSDANLKILQFQRCEIVALLNALGRLSNSITSIENFRAVRDDEINANSIQRATWKLRVPHTSFIAVGLLVGIITCFFYMGHILFPKQPTRPNK